MTNIHVTIDRLILHGLHQGLSPELSRDLGPLITSRLETLAADGDPDRSHVPMSESHRIADLVAHEVWRSVEASRVEGGREGAT